MQIDFAAILVIGAAVTGAIWVLDILVLAPRRQQVVAGHPGKAQVADTAAPLPWYVDLARSFFPVIIAVLILRSFVIEPFRIPSGSMEPTLYAGDFILVNKFSYGLRLPVTNTKIIELGEPQHGDVVVFRYPEDPKTAFIKRIVGLPGDRIDYRGKQIFVNGEPVPQEPLPHLNRIGRFDVRTETAGENRYTIQIDPAIGSRDLAYQVPEGHYFVMGDNRDNSSDSRRWGFLSEDNLIGKAFFIWMNWDCITFNGNCHRIGSTIE